MKHERYELQMQLLHETVLQLLSRAVERTTHFPQNGYRRRIYFEEMTRLADDLSLVSAAAAALVRVAGRDIEAAGR